MGVVLREHAVRGETHIQCNSNGEIAAAAVLLGRSPQQTRQEYSWLRSVANCLKRIYNKYNK